MTKKQKRLLFLLLRFVLTAAAVFLLLAFVAAPRIVRGNAMYPSLRDGQLILVSRVSRILPQSVVLYKTAEGKEQCGRVIALEEDEVRIEENAGILVNEVLEARKIPFPVPPGTLSYPYQVSEESFFLVNDYREDAKDSRSFGAVAKKDVVGVVVFAMQYRDF